MQFQLLNRQNLDAAKYGAAYDAAFPGGGYDPMTGQPYPADVWHRHVVDHDDHAMMRPDTPADWLPRRPPPNGVDAGQPDGRDWRPTSGALHTRMTRIALLVLGTVVLCLLLWRLGPAEILRTMAVLGWHAVPVLLLYGVYQVMRAVAFRLSLPRPREFPFLDALWIRLSGDAVRALTFTGPFLGEPTKAWLLKRHGFTLAQGFAATLTAAILNLVLGAAMGTAGLAYLLRHTVMPAPAARMTTALVWVNIAFLIIVAAAVVTRTYLIGAVLGWLSRAGVLRGRFKPDIAAVNRMEDLLLGILHDRPGRAGAILLAEIGGQVALVLELAWILAALDFGTPLSSALIIESATKFITVVFFFVPLQMGASEGAYAVVFGALGLSAAAGFSVSFFRRFRSLLVATAGLAALDRLTRRTTQPRQTPEPGPGA